MSLTESTVDDAALGLFGKLDYFHHYGSSTAHCDPAAGLFQISIQIVCMYIRNVFAGDELQADSVVKEFLTTAGDGKSHTTQRMRRGVQKLEASL